MIRDGEFLQSRFCGKFNSVVFENPVFRELQLPLDRRGLVLGVL
jgi:hypothetical protein